MNYYEDGEGDPKTIQNKLNGNQWTHGLNHSSKRLTPRAAPQLSRTMRLLSKDWLKEIEYVDVASQDYGTKAGTMLAGGDTSDIFMIKINRARH